MEFKVFKQLNLPAEQLSLAEEKGDIDRANRPWEIIPSGHKIGNPEPLFKELVCNPFFLSHSIIVIRYSGSYIVI